MKDRLGLISRNSCIIVGTIHSETLRKVVFLPTSRAPRFCGTFLGSFAHMILENTYIGLPP